MWFLSESHNKTSLHLIPVWKCSTTCLFSIPLPFLPFNILFLPCFKKCFLPLIWTVSDYCTSMNEAYSATSGRSSCFYHILDIFDGRTLHDPSNHAVCQARSHMFFPSDNWTQTPYPQLPCPCQFKDGNQSLNRSINLPIMRSVSKADRWSIGQSSNWLTLIS